VYQVAGIRIEVKNAGGTPEWDGDYCHDHAERLVKKAKAVGIRIIDDEQRSYVSTAAQPLTR
jgi:hypothetical protein